MNYERVPVLVPSKRLIALAIGIIAAFVLVLGVVADARASEGSDKVYVCKYVGTPGDGERLQTGQNPIEVSVNSIPDYQGVGSYFADQHGRSYVLANAPLDPEPSASSCPGGTDPSSAPSAPPSVEPSTSPEPSSSPTATPSSKPSDAPSSSPKTPATTPSARGAELPSTDATTPATSDAVRRENLIAIAAILAFIVGFAYVMRPPKRNR